MFTTRLYLDCRKSKPGRPAPLKLAIANSSERSLLPLNIDVLPEFWDKDNQVTLDKYEHLNVLISQKKTFIESMLFQLDMTGESKDLKAVDAKNLILEKLQGGKTAAQSTEEVSEDSFYSRFHYFMNNHKGRTKEIYNETAKKIKNYIGENAFKSLKFEDITVKWLKDFDRSMEAAKISKNSRNIHFRNIRAVFNDAIDDEVISCYPFRKFKIKAEPTPKRSLCVEDLRTLFTMKVQKLEEIYQDMFKLIFLLIGINTVDLYALKKITSDGRIEYKRAKTHKLYSIKVEPEAMEIIKKWKGKRGLTRISDRWVDSVSFRHRFNKALRLLGAKRSGRGGKKSEGMFPEITSYWARHTWATIAADLDIPDAVISMALGHSAENRVTDIYIRRNQKKVDEANRKVIDWVFYNKK